MAAAPGIRGKIYDDITQTVGNTPLIRLRRVALNYDVAWGEYQASNRVLDTLDNLSRLEAIPASVMVPATKPPLLLSRRRTRPVPGLTALSGRVVVPLSW